MKRFRWGTREGDKEKLNFDMGRTATDTYGEINIRDIVDEFRKASSDEKKDEILLQYTEKFDNVKLDAGQIVVSEAEMNGALESLTSEVREALELAAKRIRTFHEACLPEKVEVTAPGEKLALRPTPLRRVGLYIPGGTAAYPSTVLMSALAAKVAGVEEIVICTPSGEDGNVPASVLGAAKIVGVEKMFRVGGAQAIAAMAYGTKSVPAVDKIVGPGNAYVTAAKRLVREKVEIDKEAGPSEVVVVLDNPQKAKWAAADMIAQAEHDTEAMAVGVAVGSAAADALKKEVEGQLEGAERRDVIEAALNQRGLIIEVKNLDETLEAVEWASPEHLELMIENAEAFADKVRNAGAIFCGPWSPVPLGDYIAGPNHVLPTGRAARYASPLGVLDFIKWTSVVSFDEAASKRLAGPAAVLADLEGLPGHARALRMRLDKE
jgi:histidinol dehydrogenase